MNNWYVCSLIVLVKKSQFIQVKQQLSHLPNTEIYAEKADEGKLIVVLESHLEFELVERMTQIRELDGVMVISLIYSHQDEIDC